MLIAVATDTFIKHPYSTLIAAFRTSTEITQALLQSVNASSMNLKVLLWPSALYRSQMQLSYARH